MGGFKVGSVGLVLVLANWDLHGVWFCFGATPTGCSVQSTFIILPVAFCSKMRAAYCNPDGSVLDSNLNLYYADVVNDIVVECNYASAYKSCTILEDFYPSGPQTIFVDSTGNLWVSDNSCAGTVWKNGVVQYTVGDELEGIVLNNANPAKALHTYVGDTGFCTNSAAHIIDLTDRSSLPTPFNGPTHTAGISTTLQFTADTAIEKVYSVQDLT